MPRALYEALKKPFDRATSRLTMSVRRRSKQETINRNQTIVDRERKCLRSHLEAFALQPAVAPDSHDTTTPQLLRLSSHDSVDPSTTSLEEMHQLLVAFGDLLGDLRTIVGGLSEALQLGVEGKGREM